MLKNNMNKTKILIILSLIIFNIKFVLYAKKFSLEIKNVLIDIQGVNPDYITKVEKILALKQKTYNNLAAVIRKLEKNKERLYEFYEDKGFDDVSISTSIVFSEKTFLPTFVIKIDEGKPAPVIEKIELEGVKSFPEAVILDLFGLKEGMYYIKRKAKVGLDRIISFYKDRGFAQMEIKDFETDMNLQMTKVNLRISIYEGQKFYVRNIKFVGNKEIPTKKLVRVFGVKKDDLFIPRKIEKGWIKLTNYYFYKTDISAQIAPFVDYYPEEGKVDILVKIDEEKTKDTKVTKDTGRPLPSFDDIENYYVDRIYIEGLEHTNKDIILREITSEIKEEDKITGEAIGNAMNRLYRLGFIKSVDVSFEPTNYKNVDVTFIIEEKEPGLLGFSLMYRPWYGFGVNFQILHFNMFRRCQKLEWSNTYGQRWGEFSLSYSIPWFLNTPLKLSFGTEYSWKNYCYSIPDTWDEFTITYKPNLFIRFRYPLLKDNLAFVTKYHFGFIAISNGDSLYVKQREKEQSESGIDLFLSYTLDLEPFSKQFIHPGIDAEIGYSLYGGIFGQEINVKKYWSSITFRTRSFSGNILSIYFFTSLLQPYGNTSETPIYMRFFPGGFGKLSGYDFWGQVGPPEGGDVEILASIRYLIPIFKVRNVGSCYLVPFFEVGNAWRKVEDIKWNFDAMDDNSFKRSVGVSVGFPVSLCIQYSHGLDAKPAEPSDFYYIGLQQLW